MKPIKFLEPEIAERIEKITSKFINQNPIEKIINLKRIVTELEHEYFDKETTDTIKDIINNHPEQLLLHFATYDPQHPSHAAFVTPISENFDCITYIRKHNDLDLTAVASILKRKDSDIEFDLTLVDTHDLDNEDSYPPGVKSYLFGNPYSEDWQHVEKTNFSSIDDVIENNK